MLSGQRPRRCELSRRTSARQPTAVPSTRPADFEGAQVAQALGTLTPAVMAIAATLARRRAGTASKTANRTPSRCPSVAASAPRDGDGALTQLRDQFEHVGNR